MATSVENATVELVGHRVVVTLTPTTNQVEAGAVHQFDPSTLFEGTVLAKDQTGLQMVGKNDPSQFFIPWTSIRMMCMKAGDEN
ncbi:MAG: hypothetical protein H0X24_00705 [Ktedonobacterales bacterium]|nr:hypothetical protein [Ktedonobacterales bacterium]